MNRVKYITQKRSALKTQITSLQNMISQGKIDSTNLKMRLKRITDLLHGFEELNDELAVIDPDNEHLSELNNIQDKYYELASQINSENVSSSLNETNQTMNQTLNPANKTRRPKLPVAELPKFDGKIECWLSFKNTFLTMIDARDDITDLQKFIHLKDSLRGAALNKIAIYNVSEENYKNAWNLLVDAYEKTRVLVSRHLDAILDLTIQSKSIHTGLSKLVDDMRQHINMLNSLNVSPDEHLLIRILERALPHDIRIKWDEKLNLETTPTLDQLYKFIAETAFRMSTLEADTARSKADSEKKRPNMSRDTRIFKSRKIEPSTRAFVSTIEANCLLCKHDKHPLHKCPEFAKMYLKRRWDFVNQAKLCKNCLRAHGGICNSTLCKICNRLHHTMLHNPNQNKFVQRGPSKQASTSAQATTSKNESA